MTPPLAVIFDLDGTLTDSEVLWAQVREGMTLAQGRDNDPRHTVAMMGMSTPEWSHYCAEVIGLAGAPEQIAGQVIGGVADAYRQGRVPILQGAAEAVRRMAGRWPLAVASSSPPVLIDAGLDAVGVGDLIDVRVSSESVGVGKPSPDVYLEACRRLGVSPADAVAIEDSANGVRAALAAGMRVVVIPQEPHVPPREVLDRADAVLASLDELTVELVEGLPGR